MRNLIRARKTPNIRDLWIGPLLDRSFRVSISLKGLHALLETICAIALLKIDPQTMNRFVLGRSASRTLRRSTRFRRHAPNPCVSVLCGQRKVLRLFVSSFARRCQTRARCSLAKKQTLGISLDDCHFSGVCLLSDLWVRSHSVLMILLTLFDVVVIFLNWLEYGQQRSRRQTESPRTMQS